MEIVPTIINFIDAFFEAIEILLKIIMDDAIIIYGIPWWQWVMGLGFFSVLGAILVRRIFK